MSEPVAVRLDQIRLERARRFGDVWLGWRLWRALALDRFCEDRLVEGRERSRWPAIAAILVIARLCEPSSELHIAEDWHRRTALDDLLGVPAERVNQAMHDEARRRAVLAGRADNERIGVEAGARLERVIVRRLAGDGDVDQRIGNRVQRQHREAVEQAAAFGREAFDRRRPGRREWPVVARQGRAEPVEQASEGIRGAREDAHRART